MTDVTYNPHAFEAAQARLTRAPAELTDADLEQLAIVDPALAQHGLVQRFKALHPDPAPVPREVPAARLDLEQVAGALVDIIAANIKPLAARLEDQQQRLAALEARPIPKYAGIYRKNTAYREATLVTHQGGMWFAHADTGDVPGSDQSAWQLVVKSGGVEQ